MNLSKEYNKSYLVSIDFAICKYGIISDKSKINQKIMKIEAIALFFTCL